MILGKRSFLHPSSHPQSFFIHQGGSLDSGLPFTCPGVDWKAVEASISLLKECDILKRLLGSVPYPPLLHPLNHLANIQCNQWRLLHLHLSPRAIWWVVVFSLMVKCLFWSSKSAHIMCHEMFQLKCRLNSQTCTTYLLLSLSQPSDEPSMSSSTHFLLGVTHCCPWLSSNTVVRLQCSHKQFVRTLSSIY